MERDAYVITTFTIAKLPENSLNFGNRTSNYTTCASGLFFSEFSASLTFFFSKERHNKGIESRRGSQMKEKLNGRK